MRVSRFSAGISPEVQRPREELLRVQRELPARGARVERVLPGGVVGRDPAAAEGGRVEPTLLAPAGDVRRVEEPLAVDLGDPRPGARVDRTSARSEHAGDLDDRWLQHRGPGVEARVAEDGADDRRDLVAGALVERLQRGLGRRGRRCRDEVAPEPADEIGQVGRVLDAETAGVLPAEVPALPEDDLHPVVVPRGVVAEVDVADAVLPVVSPAGERPGLLADVVLRVPASGAEGEDLHQLARVVLVRAPLRVVPPVQPDQHRRIVGHGDQEGFEVPESVLPKEAVLGQHPLLRADAGVGRREPVVPDEGHPLDELLVRAHHAVEPPEMVVAPGVAGRERLAAVGGRRLADEPGCSEDAAGRRPPASAPCAPPPWPRPASARSRRARAAVQLPSCRTDRGRREPVGRPPPNESRRDRGGRPLLV